MNGDEACSITRSAWRSRRPLVLFGALALSAMAAACADRVPTSSTGARERAALAIAPSFDAVSGGPVITLGLVRALLISPSGDTVKASAQFVGDSATLSFDVAFVATEADYLLVLTAYDLNGQVAFTGQELVPLKGGGSSTVASPQMHYAAPDAAVTAIKVAPSIDTLSTGATQTLSVTGTNAAGQPVSPIRVGWTTQDSTIAKVDTSGLVHGGSSSGSVWIVARTATGVTDSARVTVQVGMAIAPATAEKLPGGTQRFTVTVGPPGPYIWSVYGVDGGNLNFGTVDSTGFYSAPMLTPTPATFSVCARVKAAPTESGCASVTIDPVPTPGGDVIVFNDVDVFGDDGAADPNNQQLFKNLVGFTGTGSRAGKKTVLFYDGHGSINPYPLAIMRATVNSAGYTIADSTSNLAAIDSNVKTIFLWLPTIAFSDTEINVLKAFSATGGRIVFDGEWDGFYGAGIAVENTFFLQMGAQMTNQGGGYDCGSVMLPAASLRLHEVTTGMTGMTVGCASNVIPGPNDYPLVYSLQDSTKVLAAVAKVDITPLVLGSPNPAAERPAVVRFVPRSNDPTGAALRKPPPLPPLENRF